MSAGMAELYHERYPGVACSPLVHSFNEEIPECHVPPPPKSPVRFALSGNINGSCTEAVVRVCDAIAKIDSMLTILSGTDKRYLAELGILRPGVRCETVSRDVLLARLAEADVVLLAHGFTGTLSDEEYRTIFPTRTIEYLLCGRPILAHTPSNCYLTKFLREHRCALIVSDPSVEALLDAVRSLREDADLRLQLVRNALATADMFRASRVAAALRSVLDER
jgi:glycosyltransferase involved in cell wall biosynthesis